MISFPVILLRLAVALLLGAVVGFEREQKEHAAGLRTLALVSLGCALFTIVSAYGFLELLAIPHTTIDPTRIASYIVAGIGFLGGGTIFLSRQNEKVKGNRHYMSYSGSGNHSQSHRRSTFLIRH